jgi:hypothetical protein
VLRLRLITAAIVAAIALALLAACGDDDAEGGDQSVDTTPTETTAEQATPELPKELETKPKVEVPSGPPPKELKTRDIVKGKGRAVKGGDAGRCSTWASSTRMASSSTPPGTRGSRSRSRSAAAR